RPGWPAVGWSQSGGCVTVPVAPRSCAVRRPSAAGERAQAVAALHPEPRVWNVVLLAGRELDLHPLGAVLAAPRGRVDVAAAGLADRLVARRAEDVVDRLAGGLVGALVDPDAAIRCARSAVARDGADDRAVVGGGPQRAGLARRHPGCIGRR